MLYFSKTLDLHIIHLSNFAVTQTDDCPCVGLNMADVLKMEGIFLSDSPCV